ncbi:MAG TPA: DNA mismatch repair endonuclease MutL, partial [Anaeromyxobacter sp.]
MARIHVLPPGLVNQIAAGEVVERPASVVKELVENALDACARAIAIDVEEGGLALVRVADDGSGMDREDALLALERHATSKLRDAEGLHAIATMGFRGEALPAIASVSRFRLDTAAAIDGAGTRVEIAGGAPPEVSDVARPRGTTVEVRDLFFNTPARRKFMRAAPTEAGHVTEAVTRLALARPDVGFTVRSGGRVALGTRAGDPLRDRAAQAIGRDAHRHLLPLDATRGAVRVHGLVCSPDRSEATQRALYLFVNGRWVRDRGAAHAVLRAFAGSLPAGRHPAGVLFVELPLARVDVNVHPQKHEVRFADAREVQDAIFHAVAGTLRTAPWL